MRNKNNGFSLVELIVVIAIMAVLIGVAVPVYSGYVEKAQETKDAQFLADLSKTAQLFAAEKGLELGTIWVAPVITETEGILLYDKQGNFYDGDLSQLYSMLGGTYDFETIQNNTPIYITPDVEPVEPDETPAEHEHTVGRIVEPTCVSAGYTVCGDASCRKKYDIQVSSGHTLSAEQVGNMKIERCANCDYVKVSFSGSQIGG